MELLGKYVYDFPMAAVTVDIGVLRNSQNNDLEILLIRRKEDPFKGMWALPGGHVELGKETLLEAAYRELEEETLIPKQALIDGPIQVGVFGNPGRDPRGHYFSVVFKVCLDSQYDHTLIQANDDAAEVKWFLYDELPPMAFDHEEMISQLVSAPW